MSRLRPPALLAVPAVAAALLTGCSPTPTIYDQAQSSPGVGLISSATPTPAPLPSSAERRAFLRQVRAGSPGLAMDDQQLLAEGGRYCRLRAAGDTADYTDELIAGGIDPSSATRLVQIARLRLCPGG